MARKLNRYTAEEAGSKWCPSVTFANTDKGHVRHSNRPHKLNHGGQHESYCIASECMHWKLDVETVDGEHTGACGKVF